MAAMAAILDFRSKRFLLVLIYKVPRYILTGFDSVGLSVQEKKCKIELQNGGLGCHLGFPIGTILATSLSAGCPDSSNQSSIN